MTEPEPQRARVRIEDPLPEPDPVRTGCLWAGGVLGVIAGVVVTFLAVPSILNFLFPSETIEVGKTFENDKLEMQVLEVVVVPDRSAYVVDLSVDAKSSWRPGPGNFVLVLSDGEELDAASVRIPGDDSHSDTIPQGHSLVQVAFEVAVTEGLAPPDSLHMEEPPVKFELPAPVTP